MSHDYKNPEFKKLLQKLQEESWQLELLISGFAIFGLFTAIEPFQAGVIEGRNGEQIYQFVISLVALISCYILIFNLLLHVLLRGLWIGALGLRYVSGDIDYDSLKYSNLFTKYLKKRVGSFDKYIATLENYCSVIFAISFLLVFYVLALTFTILAISLISIQLIGNDDLPNWISNGIGITVVVFLSVGMLLVFIDFVTLGFLKKKKWTSYIYFPVYWIFQFITLSFLYRPLVYNFLDNKFGRRLSFSLIPFYLIIIFATSYSYKTSNYFALDTRSNEYIANQNSYLDQITEKTDFVNNIAIQSKAISDQYVRIFMIFDEDIEDRVFAFNKGLEPEKDQRGLDSQIYVNNFINASERDSLRREYLKTLNFIYSIKIDTLEFKTDFVLSSGPQKKLGFDTYLSTKDLSDGKHVLKINRKRIRKEDTFEVSEARIPFWYFKDN